MLGKEVSDLQSDITVTESRISGSLAYVDDYTNFDEDTDLQSGHYLALKFEATDGATITAQLIGGEEDEDPVTVDSNDMNVVLRITDPSVQKVKIVATKSNYTTATKVYTLTGLRLEPEE